MNAVVNEQGGTAYAARIKDAGLEMGGKSGTSQVRRISQYERDHGVRKATEVPWKERDHALFVAFAPVGGAALCLRRRRRARRRERRRRLGGRGADLPRRAARGAAARPGAASAAARCAGPGRARPAAARPGAAADPRGRAAPLKRRMTSFSPDIGQRALTFADKLRGIQWGLVLLVAAISGDRLRDALLGRERRLPALGVAPDDAVCDCPGADDRGGADRHSLLVPQRLLDLRRWRWLLVIAVDLRGIAGMGAQRWIGLGFMQLQPSEIMKIALVLALARYFHSVSAEDVGRLRYLVVPALMVVIPGPPGAEAARPRHRDDAARGRRRAVLPRRGAAVDVRGGRRWRPRRRRRSPGRCCAIIRRPGSIPFSIPSATRSAPAITSCNRRSRSAPAACSARAFCTARKAI